jgi:uncharacterized protein YqeY
MEDVMLADRLSQDMKAAMKARDALRVSVLRLALSEVKNARIEKGEDLTDEDVIQVLRRGVKRREEAAEQYRKGSREDLADRETREGEILQAYLPQVLEGEALERAVETAIQEANAQSLKDLGKVMKILMSAHAGRLDGKSVQALVRARLQG